MGNVLYLVLSISCEGFGERRRGRTAPKDYIGLVSAGGKIKVRGVQKEVQIRELLCV
jgi:ABC-type transporter Mla subunit MlaD